MTKPDLSRHAQIAHDLLHAGSGAGQPAVSPDGAHVAGVVTTIDVDAFVTAPFAGVVVEIDGIRTVHDDLIGIHVRVDHLRVGMVDGQECGGHACVGLPFVSESVLQGSVLDHEE